MAFLEEYDWWLINELSFKIHTLEDETEMRQTVLALFNKLIRFDMGHFYLVSQEKGVFHYSSPVYLGFSKEDLAFYLERGETIDFHQWLFYNRKNSAYRESDLVSSSTLQESDIFTQYYAPAHIDHVCRMFLVYQGELCGIITLYRKNSGENFSERDLYILNQLQDHLSYRLSAQRNGFGFHSKLAEKHKKIISQYSLTDREAEVYLLTVKGLDNVEIAEKMCISPNTLKKHLSSIYSKMNISSRMQLMKINAQ
ncbi:MAG: hypothetical protein HFE73_07380 [Firmicutes bacterium]|nr:hypothetical protein [Bacillota bacterium]